MSNAALVNFVAGETSPRSRGRFDLSWFKSSCEKLLNFTPEVPGSARFRTGFKTIRQTRGGAAAVMIPFQFNNARAFMLEFTAGFMRVYKNEELLTTARTTLTAATKANPCVITVAATTDLANGDEIIISDAIGMVELNGRQVKLANKAGSTYQLIDPVTGAGIDSTSFGTWTSGGTVSEVYEIASPYVFEDDLVDISFSPNAANGVMYLAHPEYAPRRLTVDSADRFTITTYARTNDPFVAGTALNIGTGGEGIDRSGDSFLAGGTVTAGYTVIWFPLGTTIVPDTLYTFAGVVGTTEINGGVYTLTVFEYNDAISNVVTPGASVPWNAVTAIIKTALGENVNSAAWTAYVSGGTATPGVENPIAVGFHEGRLGFFGTNQRPGTFFLSRAPSSAGVSRYDDFTGGVDADHACFFTLSPANGQVDYITWARGDADNLFVGSFGGPFRVTGGGLNEPITPSSINVKQIDSFGCEAVAPAGSSRLFFIQRGGVALRTMRYDADGKLETYDMLLNAEHFADSRLQRTVLQTGRPDVLWVLREDGILVGMTVQGAENIAGWHRVKIGGIDAKVVDVKVLTRTDRNDQLWIVARRVVGGVTRHFIEIQADDVVFPDIEDFFAGQGDLNRENDLETWKNAVYRRQEEYIHLDAASTYNGADRGTDAAATLTPGAITGEDITFTASAAVFKSTDVGNELWKKPDRDTGIGGGRAIITAFVSTTQVTCDIDVDFDHANAIAAGEWHIATETIRGLWHLEGQLVAIVTDGAVYSDGNQDVDSDYPLVIVTNGAITLTDPAAVVHVGLPYEGFMKTHNLELGGQDGPTQAKPRNISEAFIRFLYTLGVDFGTDLYDLETVEWRTADDATDRPAPVFSGIRKIPTKDSWTREEGKHVIVSQRLPLPCVVQFIDVHFDTSEGG